MSKTYQLQRQFIFQIKVSIIYNINRKLGTMLDLMRNIKSPTVISEFDTTAGL